MTLKHPSRNPDKTVQAIWSELEPGSTALGYYSMQDPMHIYVRDNLDDATKWEVRGHESFHRASLMSTLYGMFAFTLLQFLEGWGDRIPARRRRVLTAFIERINRSMYVTQEGGAITRGLASRLISGYPGCDEDWLAIASTYLARLTPHYKRVAALYAPLPVGVCTPGLSALTLAVVNDVIAYWAMNPVSLISEDLVISYQSSAVFGERMAPDLRLGVLMELFAKRENVRKFGQHVADGLAQLTNLEPADTAAIHAALVQGFRETGRDLEWEERLVQVYDDALQSVAPKQATPCTGRQWFTTRLTLLRQMDAFFTQEVGNYRPPTRPVIMDLATAREILGSVPADQVHAEGQYQWIVRVDADTGARYRLFTPEAKRYVADYDTLETTF